MTVSINARTRSAPYTDWQVSPTTSSSWVGA